MLSKDLDLDLVPHRVEVDGPDVVRRDDDDADDDAHVAAIRVDARRGVVGGREVDAARETRPRRPRSPRRITVVACLEGQNCVDYYDGRFPKRGYRAKGGKRRKVQFEHEDAVLKVLTRKGLEVSCEARVTLLSEADNFMRAGRPRGAAAS